MLTASILHHVVFIFRHVYHYGLSFPTLFWIFSAVAIIPVASMVLLVKRKENKKEIKK